MALRQRKGKASEKEANKVSKLSDDDDRRKKRKKDKPVDKRYKKKITGRQAFLFLLTVLCLTGAILYYYYTKYGPAMFLGTNYKDYNIEPYQWRKYLDNDDKSILLIGGPHRSGTTIVWKAITSHPEVVGFGDRFATGADFSEGVLFQDLYPAFGVGLEFRTNFAGAGIKKVKGQDVVTDASQGGLGQYALLPESYVHWTKENHKGKLDDPTSLSMLMNRFAPHWDQNKKYGGEGGLKKAKVWVEKSPQNAVLSLFLEGVYNMPILEDGSIAQSSAATKKTGTKFLYMTRHPIANVYATDIFIQQAMGGKRDFEVMLRNYIQLHKYMQMDAKELNSPVMWVKLEDFTENPSKMLKRIFSFLEVPSDEDIVRNVLEEVGQIKSNPNSKYVSQWCEGGAETHKDLITKYNDEIISLDLGYDMTSICL